MFLFGVFSYLGFLGLILAGSKYESADKLYGVLRMSLGDSTLLNAYGSAEHLAAGVENETLQPRILSGELSTQIGCSDYTSGRELAQIFGSRLRVFFVDRIKDSMCFYYSSSDPTDAVSTLEIEALENEMTVVTPVLMLMS